MSTEGRVQRVFCALLLPWERTVLSPGSEVKAAEAGMSTTLLGRGRPREQSIFSYICVFYSPSSPRIGALSFVPSSKKNIQLKAKNEPCSDTIFFLKSSNCQAGSKTFLLQRSTFWKMQCLFNEFLVHISWLYLCRIHQNMFIFLSIFLKSIRKMSGFQNKVNINLKRKEERCSCYQVIIM